MRCQGAPFWGLTRILLGRVQFYSPDKNLLPTVLMAVAPNEHLSKNFGPLQQFRLHNIGLALDWLRSQSDFVRASSILLTWQKFRRYELCSSRWFPMKISLKTSGNSSISDHILYSSLRIDWGLRQIVSGRVQSYWSDNNFVAASSDRAKGAQRKPPWNLGAIPAVQMSWYTHRSGLIDLEVWRRSP